MTIFLRNLPVNYRRFAACTFSSDRVIGGLLAAGLYIGTLYFDNRSRDPLSLQ